MKLFRNVIFVFLLCLPILPLFADDFYVAPNGGNGRGTISDPWSLSHANSQLKGGDRAILRGGIYINQQIAPASSGTSESARIIYEAYNNEDPKFRSTGEIRTPIIIANRSYITIDGISADGEGIYKDSNYDYWAYFDGTTHSIIKNSKFIRSRGYSAIKIRNSSHHNVIANNNFDLNGTWDVFKWDGEHDDTGSSMWIYPGNNYNLIEGNSFSRSGHDLGKVQGDFNVVRNNIYDNFWEIYSGTAYTWKSGDIKNGDRVGNRAFTMSVGSRNLIENNVFKNVPESTDNSYLAIMKLGGKNQIVRKNYFMNGVHTGIYGMVGASNHVLSENKVFNNTFYNLGGPVITLEAFNADDPAPANNIFKNNLVYKTRSNPKSESHNVDIYVKNFKKYYGNYMLNNIFSYNCLASDLTASSQNVKTEQGGINTLDYYERYSKEYFNNNIQANPSFVSNDPKMPKDLNLNSKSPCVDAGDDLTTVKNAGSGFVIPVEDAGYFTDGFGIVEGDQIRVGSQVVVITKVDYSRNKLTVDRSISWELSDGVNLSFVTGAPDIGASELNEELSSVVVLPPGGIQLFVQ